MAVFGLTVGILGMLVSVLALIYAALAAHRSEALLKRLVIYPYRELDIGIGKLTATERDALLTLYTSTGDGKRLIDPEILADARLAIPDLSSQMLAYLAENSWLEKSLPTAYRFNPDRLPYLHFLHETHGS